MTWKIESDTFGRDAKIEIEVTGADCVNDAEMFFQFMEKNVSAAFYNKLIKMIAKDVELSGRVSPEWIRRRL